MFQLDLKSRKSIYEQVVDNIKEQIITGLLSPEEKLPSVRELSKVLTVNPNTIQKAYKELENQSYIYIVSGQGAFISKATDIRVDEIKKAEIERSLVANFLELLYMGVSMEELEYFLHESLTRFNERSTAK